MGKKWKWPPNPKLLDMGKYIVFCIINNNIRSYYLQRYSSLSDCNGIRTQNHVVHKRTLSHLVVIIFQPITMFKVSVLLFVIKLYTNISK